MDIISVFSPREDEHYYCTLFACTYVLFSFKRLLVSVHVLPGDDSCYNSSVLLTEENIRYYLPAKKKVYCSVFLLLITANFGEASWFCCILGLEMIVLLLLLLLYLESTKMETVLPTSPRSPTPLRRTPGIQNSKMGSYTWSGDGC
jgi:hypothetical protein